MDSNIILDLNNQSAVWQSRDQYIQKPKDEITQVVVFLDSSPERDPFSWIMEFDSRTEGVMTIPLRPPNLAYLMVKNVIIPLSFLEPFPSRYIVLRIRELCIINQYYSNAYMNPQTDIVLKNNGVAGPNTFWECRNMIAFRPNVMKAVSRLTFQFLDPNGNPLVVPDGAIPTAGGTGDPSHDYPHTFTAVRNLRLSSSVAVSEGVLVELGLGVVDADR